MKKLKLISPILATTAAVAPLTMLATSCSKFDYTKYCKILKEDTFNMFKSILCGKGAYRETFDCEQGYNKIIETMSTLGYTPIHADKWSKIAHDDFEAFPSTSGENNPVHGDYGNVWYDIPATQGYETWPKIILSAYYDTSYDLPKDEPARGQMIEKIKNEGIELQIDEEKQTVRVKDSVCGAGFSDGLGVAFLFAIAKDHNQFPHGPIRLLFTADSLDSTPTYAGGAHYLQVSQEGLSAGQRPFDTPYVICTDGYNQGEIFISSAGIHQCQFSRDATADEFSLIDFDAPDPTDPTKKLYKGRPYKVEIEVSGMTGAQSGTEAYKNCGNAIKILMEMLTNTYQGFRIADITTNETSAYRVPSQCKATFYQEVVYDDDGYDVTDKHYQDLSKTLTTIYENAHPIEKGKIKIEAKTTLIDPATTGVYALSRAYSNKLCLFVNLVKSDVFVWFDDEHKEPKTSGNICPLNVKAKSTPSEGFAISGAYTGRSASKTQLDYYADDAHNYLDNILGMSSDYVVDVATPVWENSYDTYKIRNKMADMLNDAYKRFRYTPKQVNCHGCLEAVNHAYVIENFYNKGKSTIPYISTIGPTITNFQTKNEVFYSSTVNSCIRAVLYVLQNCRAFE